jgi:hypothetical protein
MIDYDLSTILINLFHQPNQRCFSPSNLRAFAALREPQTSNKKEKGEKIANYSFLPFQLFIS